MSPEYIRNLDGSLAENFVFYRILPLHPNFGVEKITKTWHSAGRRVPLLNPLAMSRRRTVWNLFIILQWHPAKL